ncbi:hypothetical protein MTP99_012495 [Tenebrio molitor]|nr:hypothetical protein MTP99_012495 [Tenebrio molitor]
MPVANNVVPAVAVNHIPDCSPTDQQTPENSDQNRVKPQDHHKAIHSQKEAKVHQHKGKSHYHEKHQEKIHNRER